MKYKRTLEKRFLVSLGKKPITILYGARQVGKTTFVKNILSRYQSPLYLQGDDPRDKTRLENKSASELLSLISGHDLVVIDEAQQIQNIGTTLKLIADNLPTAQIIATGSSSFELANKLNEPLTGRNRKFTMYPLSVEELVGTYGLKDVENNLFEYITFGSYPEVISALSIQDKKEALTHLATDYLFKDIFQFSKIKNSFLFEKIVQLLALRIGSEISYSEIAKEVGISRETLYGYITMLEQAFIIFRVTPLYTNKTKEINKNHKIYFYDTGIRNAVLRAFDSLELRNDKGALFENYFIAEMVKQREYRQRYTDIHFWRSRQGGEVDFVETSNAGETVNAFECKWKNRESVPKAFQHLYPNATFQCITTENIVQFFAKKEKE